MTGYGGAFLLDGGGGGKAEGIAGGSKDVSVPCGGEDGTFAFV
jgi:hypothetical protein